MFVETESGSVGSLVIDMNETDVKQYKTAGSVCVLNCSDSNFQSDHNLPPPSTPPICVICVSYRPSTCKAQSKL